MVTSALTINCSHQASCHNCNYLTSHGRSNLDVKLSWRVTVLVEVSPPVDKAVEPRKTQWQLLAQALALNQSFCMLLVIRGMVKLVSREPHYL